ncbi:putative ABC transporter ATP-binding protein [Spiroplasma clarkii]|uniref:hypothetical protein n=1 Tax=Spiroplasma clarkii TaxID=2139 RepID=UPI000B563CEB|nr:hypothetical protein [Spiroplasma clarkii]ARU92112.1 putative ABC transporter ATP-binding protein [Spiroplasma clarkii]
MLLDEPTSNLDNNYISAIYEKFKSFNTDKIIVLITHNLTLLTKQRSELNS